MNGKSDSHGENPHGCAACMHEGKSCEESCPLAPYFPSSRYDEFQNAYKHFGSLCNIVRIMDSVEPYQRQAAAESILFEGNARLIHPVHGCLGVVQSLQSIIGFYVSELEVVNKQLAFFKGNIDQHQKQPSDDSTVSSSSSAPPPQPLQPVHGELADMFDQGDNAGGLNLEEDDHDPTDQTMDHNQNGTE
ncbi:hypothetical protein PTKIN_Ptkin03bG0233200 [Pterospermum kingtungense]